VSDFSVPVVRIAEVRKHGNADTLSITNILGEDVIFKNGDFTVGDLAIYVPVDAVVPPTVPRHRVPGRQRAEPAHQGQEAPRRLQRGPAAAAPHAAV
jgi:hypothetical protein